MIGGKSASRRKKSVSISKKSGPVPQNRLIYAQMGQRRPTGPKDMSPMAHLEFEDPTKDPTNPDETEAHLPQDHWPLPEITHIAHAEKHDPTTNEFLAVAATPQFQKLRSTFRGFAFPMTIAGLVSYFVFVILSVFAPTFMGTPLFGNLSIGMTIGLAQFAVTWTWTALYVRFASRRLDPVSTALKAELEKVI